MDGYRHSGDRRPLRRSLGSVLLAGPPRRIALTIAAARILGSLGACVALLLPWHEVRITSGGAFCWAPDCGPATLGPPSTCSASDHVHAVGVELLVCVVVVTLVRGRRPSLVRAFQLSLVEGGLLVGIFYASFDLKHLFDHVTHRAGEDLFWTGFLLIAASIALDLLTTPILYVWARARLPPLDAPPTS